ncbi:MAG: phosphoribosylamine--glycine ligase [Eubacteriales bacterium]
MKSKVAVIGGGGREHAIIKALKKSPEISSLYALPGNAGIGFDAERADISPTDIPGVLDFAKKNQIDFIVISPDDPLVLGMADALEEAGFKVFGPSKKAAMIEGSKVFAKSLMSRHKIPTASYFVFDSLAGAKKHIERCEYPVVIKADGLALGKGVIIAEDSAAAKNALERIMGEKVFGDSGNKVVIEEFLTGPEVTVLALTDGKTICPLASSMDHKRAYDGDKGPNTGGMGVIAPNPFYTKEIEETCLRRIFLPTINALREEGRAFKGCLYFGLMLTKSGPKVIEYNCRFGDPEAQAVIPLLENDLFSLLKAVSEERLGETDIKLKKGASCTVIMASEGYPGKYKKGSEITFRPGLTGEVCFAGVKLNEGKLVTNGGRVLGVTNVAETLEKAISMTYNDINKISFDGAFYRKDIGAAAIYKKA